MHEMDDFLPGGEEFEARRQLVDAVVKAMARLTVEDKADILNQLMAPTCYEPAGEPDPETGVASATLSEPGTGVAIATPSEPGTAYPEFNRDAARMRVGLPKPEPKRALKPYPPMNSDYAVLDPRTGTPAPPPPPREAPSQPSPWDQPAMQTTTRTPSFAPATSERYQMCYLTDTEGRCCLCGNYMTEAHYDSYACRKNRRTAYDLDVLAGPRPNYHRELCAGMPGLQNVENLVGFWGEDMANGAEKFAQMAWAVLQQRGGFWIKTGTSNKAKQWFVGMTDIQTISVTIVSYHLHCKKYSGQIAMCITQVPLHRGLGMPAPLPATWWPTIRVHFKPEATLLRSIEAYICIYQLVEPKLDAWCGGW